MDTPNKKQNKTTRLLIGGFMFLLVISATAFVCLGYYTSRVSKNAIDKVGNMYMTGINEQITAHFWTLINLKMEQAETAVKVVSSNMEDIDELYEELIYRIQVRNFEYLALCSEEGQMEMVYGEQIQLADPDPFFRSLRRKEKKSQWVRMSRAMR